MTIHIEVLESAQTVLENYDKGHSMPNEMIMSPTPSELADFGT